MSVFVLMAEHPIVPPTIVKVFATQDGAEREAADLVKIMAKDCRILERPTWQETLLVLQDQFGAEHCDVEIIESEVLP